MDNIIDINGKLNDKESNTLIEFAADLDYLVIEALHACPKSNEVVFSIICNRLAEHVNNYTGDKQQMVHALTRVWSKYYEKD